MKKIRKRSFLPIITIEEHKEFIEDPYDFVCHDVLIKRLIEDDNLTYIVKHFDELCKDREHLPELLEYMSFWSFRIKNKDVLEKLKGALVYEMLYDKVIVKDDDIDKIKFMINEVAKSQNLSFFDIKPIGTGSFSTVYRLGDKVIKIGKRRVTKIIDNNRLYLPDKLEHVAGNTIEITDYLEGVGRVCDDEIYAVYKELREQGIMWMDPWFSNLARLNSKTLESLQEKSKNRSSLPFLIENRKFIYRQLRSNDPVIIDLDHLIDETNKAEIKRISKNINEFRDETRKRYEKRYLLEKKKGDSYGIF